ncbi:MAG TPA: GNAT family N-acetyltransferase [Myxococcota bacterium]|nr:GNAT family N-acetyltransferase [Myxococcota bacterium]
MSEAASSAWYLAPMIEIALSHGDIGPREIEEIAGLFEACFGQASDTDFAERVREKRRPLALIARDGGKAVGYKLGYERSRGVFFSWLGGVLPSRRRLGIARELLRRQHAWCEENGYTKVLTESTNRWKEMLILNLTEGFDIMGVHLDANCALHVEMRKELGDSTS